MTAKTSETFDQNAREALKEPQLRSALRNLARTFGERRSEAISSVPDWQYLRERAREIKDETLSHLDKYLERFAASAERAGAIVHWARDGHEACHIVLELINEASATNVVKSKSMATEEIHLNQALEKAGIYPVETDLGEWIIQLAGETPSHIVVPAIHKTKAQIADLFVEKVGIEKTDDVSVLTATAREFLRSKFAESEVGISGVNFGIAETGTLVIIENEGNIRLTTGVPKRHIALMGIEKIIPRLTDVDVFLKLLPRSGTGQKLTTYQSFITGTKRNSSDEGPEELHIILMDNGRSRMLAHPVTRQGLACIRCGACLNACPVYQQIGGHAYGSVYPGPIGAVITPQLIGLDKAKQLPYASSLCGACREVCPVKIDIPEMLLHLRTQITEGAAEHSQAEVSPKVKGTERLIFSLYGFAWRRPWMYRLGMQAARISRAVFLGNGRSNKPGLLARLVSPAAAWNQERNIPQVAKRSFQEIWRSELRDQK
jgi:L-lactate dehydrogenase complex protein LldF